MIIREVTKDDLETIEHLNSLQGDFKITTENACIIDRIVYEGNKVIAYGVVKKLAEAIILVNPKVPQITRAKAMRELMKYAEIGSKNAGCEQLHCFVKDLRLARTLENQFGFVQSHDIVLVKNF